MEHLTITAAGQRVSAPIQIWLTVLLNCLPRATLERALQQVKQMEGDRFNLLNPDGSTTFVVRADPGILNTKGDL